MNTPIEKSDGLVVIVTDQTLVACGHHFRNLRILALNLAKYAAPGTDAQNDILALADFAGTAYDFLDRQTRAILDLRKIWGESPAVTPSHEMQINKAVH